MHTLMLKSIPLFSSLPEEELFHLDQLLKPVTLQANNTLFCEGDIGDCFYILARGQLEIVKSLGTREEHILTVKEPGDYLGEMSLFDPDGLRTASVRARSDCTLYEMTFNDFDALLHRKPGLAYDLLCEFSVRLRDTDNATIQALQQKNLELSRAYQELKDAHLLIVEKEKLEQELLVARRIQTGILPTTLPYHSRVQFGARMEPARAVGGDFFDFIPLGKGKYGIAIGDVSDKGVPAAIFMAVTRSLLRAKASRTLPPHRVLQVVNRHLLGMNDANLYVTMLYGILDCNTLTFNFCRAGHEVPYVIDQHNHLLPVQRQGGQALGLLPNPELHEQTLYLPLNGILVLTTDGVTDAINPDGHFFGRSHLLETILLNREQPAQNICDRLISEITRHQAGAAQFDDITLVTIKIKP